MIQTVSKQVTETSLICFVIDIPKNYDFEHG